MFGYQCWQNILRENIKYWQKIRCVRRCRLILQENCLVEKNHKHTASPRNILKRNRNKVV